MRPRPIPSWVLLAYLIAGICFILALRGLSSPTSSQRGNRAGMLGMAIAVVTTLATHDIASIVGDRASPLLIGGAHRPGHRPPDPDDGDAAAGRGLPQPGRHGGGAGRRGGVPQSGGVRDRRRRGRRSCSVSRIEMGLGVAIGAITFSGSVIAFLKLNGNMSGKPILLPVRHVDQPRHAGRDPRADRLLSRRTSRPWIFWTVTALSFAIGFLLIIPIGGADMPVVISMLNSYSGWAAAAMGFTLHNTRDDHHRRAGRQLGRDPQLHHVPGDEPQLHLGHRRRLRRGRSRRATAAAIDRPYKRGSAEDAAFLMKQADKVIIVPGYGMAVAQAQHALREMARPAQEGRGARSNMRSTRSPAACPAT